MNRGTNPFVATSGGQIVGMLTKNAHGSREEIVTGNDANCDYPPVVTCPDARLAFSRARRIEVAGGDAGAHRLQDWGILVDHKAATFARKSHRHERNDAICALLRPRAQRLLSRASGGC